VSLHNDFHFEADFKPNLLNKTDNVRIM